MNQSNFEFTPAPRFVIEIREIEPHPSARQLPFPPRRRGENQFVQDSPDGNWYLCENSGIRPLQPQILQLNYPPHCTASVYSHGEKLLAIEADATRKDIGERDLSRTPTPPASATPIYNTNEPPEFYEDWWEPRFQWEMALYPGGSFVSVAAPKQRLQIEHTRERDDLTSCMNVYFPGRYHAETLVNDSDSGTVVGHLAFLIAIFALSIPRGRLTYAFQNYFRAGRFMKHNEPPQRNSRRGFMVKVYKHPSDHTQPTGPPTGPLTMVPDPHDVLYNYERGYYGKLFTHQ